MATVSVYGAGQLGSGVAAILTDRGVHRVLGPYSRGQRADALAQGADVVLIATTTRLADVVDDIRMAVAAGSNVLVSAEEAANPWLVDADLAEQVHQQAVAAGVTVLGAGLNPGLVFDALVLTILGAHPDDVQVTVRRFVDISGFGDTVLRRIGVGVTVAQFEKGVADGAILGHAGFPQSMSIVGRARGRETSRITAQLAPIVSGEETPFSRGRLIAAGCTVGVDQTYRAVDESGAWFTAQFVGHVAPGVAGLELRDEIVVHRGEEILQQTRATPCFASQSGSQHVLANSIDRVVDAAPGWLTVADLPPAGPRAVRD
jgi:4-hydroxy-tetrahydrodipicolinate reductase